jgi:DNA polymerase-4
MPLRQARTLCPQARYIPANPARYQAVLDMLLKVLTAFARRVETSQVLGSAVGYLALPAALEQTKAVEMARCIGQAVREQARLAPALGLAAGKFPAYVAAASVEPNRALIIAPGREAAFLSPFPVNLLPLDEETAHRLQLLGIHSLGQLAALPSQAILAQFGADGRRLHQLAHGRDEQPVPTHHPTALEHMSRQLDGAVADRAILEAILQVMATDLAERLRARGMVSRELGLILHLEDERTHSKRLVIRHPSGDPRRLAGILGELVERAPLSQGVTGLEVTLAGLTPDSGQQLDLFVPQTGQASRLREALQDLVARHGAGCFYQVSLVDRDAHLPERRFYLREVHAG